MENASKALIMAAGVLIGLLVISLAVYLFVSFGSSSAEINKQNDINQINQFNTQFTSYIGKEDVTIYDVISVANKATDNNIYYEFARRTSVSEAKDVKDLYIYVILKNDSNNNKSIEYGYGTNSNDINNAYNNIIGKELQLVGTNDLPKYNCKVEISPFTQRACKVIFTKK